MSFSTIFNIVWAVLFLAIMAYIAYEIVRARRQNVAYQHLLEQSLATSAQVNAQTAQTLAELLLNISSILELLKTGVGDGKSP